jgi:hypothetical protein
VMQLPERLQQLAFCCRCPSDVESGERQILAFRSSARRPSTAWKTWRAHNRWTTARIQSSGFTFVCESEPRVHIGLRHTTAPTIDCKSREPYLFLQPWIELNLLITCYNSWVHSSRMRMNIENYIINRFL